MGLSLALKMCAEQDTEVWLRSRSSSEGWGGGHAGRQLFGC